MEGLEEGLGEAAVGSQGAEPGGGGRVSSRVASKAGFRGLRKGGIKREV